MSNEVSSNRPRRRYYSNELRADVLRACGEPGASIAAIALSHGINANIVHRWVREQASTQNAEASRQAFLSVPLLPTVLSNGAVIEIELQRGVSVAMIRWPLQGAGECAALLRDWMR